MLQEFGPHPAAATASAGAQWRSWVRAVAVCTTVFSCSFASHAAGPEDLTSSWTFGGFGTLGYSRERDSQLDFTRDLAQAVKSPRSGSWLPDSRIGLQVGYRYSAQTEAVVQAVWRDKPAATVGNSIEWAFISHRPVPGLQIRIGRVGLDFFMLSDYRNVGFAQTAVRPSQEFYAFLPLYPLNGADVSYTLDWGDARWTLKSQYGRAKAEFPQFSGGSYEFSVDDFFDVSLVRDAGPWRVKLAFVSSNIRTELPIDELKAGLLGVAANPLLGAAIRTEAAEYARELSIAGTHVSYISAGGAYDDGTWLALAELSQINGERRAVSQGIAGYALIGRRFGELTPYAAVAAFRPRQNATEATNNWAFLGGSQLQAGAIGAINGGRIDQRTQSLGLRWDFQPRAAFKLQWDRVHIGENGYALWHAMPGSVTGSRTLNLLTATVDWVF